MTTAIYTDHLSRAFGHHLAVDSLNLEIKQGEIFGLLGHNGAGKTTTVRLLNGILNPTSGHATVLGYTPHKQGPMLRKRTGVLTETPALYEQLSARINLRVFAEIFNLDAVDERVEALLQQFDLTDRADEKVGGFSKGMKQRLALARAFLHEPEILFLDEPTAGLDPLAARQVNDAIVASSRERGRTVVLATHNLHDAQALCDRVAILEHGRLVLSGKPSDLARQTVQIRRVVWRVTDAQKHDATAIITPYAELVSDEAQGKLVSDGVAYDLLPEIVQALSAASIAVYEIIPQQPTLEDVYFSLHQEQPS